MENEIRLIDANRLEKSIYKHRSTYCHKEDVIAAIAKQPTVDAVEVVRCKDCRHWNSETGFCNLNSNFSMDGLDWDVFNDDDFCSLGERKSGGNA